MKKENESLERNLKLLVKLEGLDNVIHHIYTETEEGQKLFVEYMFGWDWESMVEMDLFQTDGGLSCLEVYKTLPVEIQFNILCELDCVDVERLILCREDNGLYYPELVGADDEFEEGFIELLKPLMRDKKLEVLGL